MGNEITFSLASLLAIGAWITLAAAATMRHSRRQLLLLFVAGRGVPLVLCVLYVGVLIIYWKHAPGGNFSSLAAVTTLFAVPGKMLGGWIHFLAFDLLVGRWLVDDTLRGRSSRASLIVSLPLTFMYGPVGVMSHVLCQLATSRAHEPLK